MEVCNVYLLRPPTAVWLMPDKGWKQAERRFAAAVGTTRIPVTGERHGADYHTELFSYQLKIRQMIPQWLFDWLDGIRQTSGRDRIGVLVLNKPRQRTGNALVVLRHDDWVALHGTVRTDDDV